MFDELRFVSVYIHDWRTFRKVVVCLSDISFPEPNSNWHSTTDIACQAEICYFEMKSKQKTIVQDSRLKQTDDDGDDEMGCGEVPALG